MRIRPLGILAVTLGGCAALSLIAACSDDPKSADSCPLPDGSTIPKDGATVDTGPNPDTDSGADAGNEDANTDGGATLQVMTALSGHVDVNWFGVNALFTPDDIVIHSTDYPQCRITLRAKARADFRADVGSLSIGGSLVGQDGGMPTPLVIPYSTDNAGIYLGFPPEGQIFNQGVSSSVQVQIEGNSGNGVPELGVTTLHSPPYASITVLTPTVPADPDDAGTGIIVKSTEDFPITWTVPTTPGADAGGAGERIIFALTETLGLSRTGELRCHFPVSAGQGRVPAALLREFRMRLDPENPVSVGRISIRTGDQREVVIPGAPGVSDTTYWVEVTDPFATTFGELGDYRASVTLD